MCSVATSFFFVNCYTGYTLLCPSLSSLRLIGSMCACVCVFNHTWLVIAMVGRSGNAIGGNPAVNVWQH